MGFTRLVEVAGRLRVKKFAPILGTGQGWILSDLPHPAFIYKNAIRVTHIYPYFLYSILSLFSQFCSSLTFSKKKFPHAAASPAISLSLSPSRCLHADISLTPPPALHHRPNFDLLYAYPATIQDSVKKNITKFVYSLFIYVNNFFFSPISTLRKNM